MNIIDYIPVGHRNAVTRDELRLMTGMHDRQIRRAIEKARSECIILNVQDGKGYYRPDPHDDVDRAEINIFYRQERRRIAAIEMTLLPVLKGVSYDK